MMLAGLLGLLGLAAVGNGFVVLRAALRQRARPSVEAAVLGAIVNFLDTLGIGSMAPTMAWFKFRKLVPDQLIPHTMIAGITLPTIVQGAIFLQLLGVAVDPVLLVGSIAALLAGGLIGIPLAARARLWVVQALVGMALVLAASFYILSNLDLMPLGGTASSLPPGLTVVAILMNFGFGILLNFGVGNYAPSLAMLSLMGLDPRLCFPIMAAGSAFTGAAMSARQMHAGRIDMRIAQAMVLAGIPAVLVAALLVKSLPIITLKWLVSAVILYTGIVMLRSAAASRKSERTPAAAT